jgi:tetratricopeptide (TPR) repeat protein
MLDGLATLVSQSLVTTEQAGGATRYRLLETLRAYAAERLAERGEAAAMQHRHAEYYVRFSEAAEAGLRGPEQAGWIRRLVREQDNLEAALRWTTSHGVADLAHRLVGALARYWYTRSRGFDEGRWYDRVLRMDTSGVPADVRARMLIGATMWAMLRGRLDEARQHAHNSLALYKPLGDSFDQARAYLNAGLVVSAEGQPDQAVALLQESLGMFRRVSSRWGEALALGHLSVLAWSRGDLDTAEHLLTSSVVAFRETNDAFELATGLAKLGDIALQHGDVDRARAHYEESLAQYQQAGMPHGDPILLHNQACVLRQQGEIGPAIRLFQEALTLYREQGDPAGIVHCLFGLADVALNARQPILAARLLGVADRLPRRLLRGWVWPGDRHLYEPLVARTRSALGEPAFEAAFTDGQSLAVEHAATEAMTLIEDARAPTQLRPRRHLA